MLVLFVVCMSLFVALGLAALLSIPSRMSSGAGLPSAAAPSEPAEARGRLAALVPPPSAVMGALPTLPGGATLQVASPIESPSADLSTIGCGEDQEETAAAVWREVRRALVQRSGKTIPSGER